MRLKSYTGQKIVPTTGVVQLKCSYKDTEKLVKFVDADVKPILGADDCAAIGLVTRIHNIQTVLSDEAKNHNIPNDIYCEFKENFQGLGCLQGKYSVKTDKSVTPVVHAPRREPIALHDKVKDELERMVITGVLVKQEELTPWDNSYNKYPRQ